MMALGGNRLLGARQLKYVPMLLDCCTSRLRLFRNGPTERRSAKVRMQAVRDRRKRRGLMVAVGGGGVVGE